MPRIDPEKLLKCIGVLLSPNGGIRSSAEVKRLSGLMEKYCKKLVSKCIYIQILKCTDTELLGQFMEAGGWKLAHGWLKEGIDTRNWPLVQELLELLLLCPVDVPRLQSNDAPRLVKSLSREGSGNDGVRILAAKLVEQWLKIAKGETMTITSQNLIVVNKEYVQSPHIPIILNKGVIYSESNKDAHDESASLDEPININGIIDRDENDSDRDVVNENNCNEGLVYKFTVKDGMQILAKVSDSSSPKKLTNQISRSNDSAIGSDSDDSKMLKVRNNNNSSSSSDRKSKDDKDASKHSSDRSKSKDRSRDKDRKSGSSSSSSHKSSSSKSSLSSSTKHSTSSSSNNHSSSSSKSHKSSNGSSGSKNGSSSSSSSSRDKSRDKHRSSSSSHSKSSSGSSRDKEKRDDKDAKSKSEASKLSQADKDKATLAKVLPQAITKIGKIPKKPSSGDDKSTSEAATDEEKKAAAAKKKSISIEVRKDADRPKTVKTYNSQFRSHGLAEEAPPPPSRRDLKKPSTTPTPGATIPSASTKRSLSPSSSATKEIEKKIKVSSPTSEKPGAIKLIPAKPKPSVLVESDMFMDAISAATNKKEVRKRKRSKESESSANSKESNGKATVPAGPMKFYQDTLDDSDTKEDKIKEENVKQENETDDYKFKSKKAKSDDESADESAAHKEESDTNADATLEEEVFENVKREPGIGCGPDGPPGVLTLHRRRGPKKSLRWRPQEALEEIRYFELDENERVNVTKTFVDAKQMEHVSEREAFLIARKSGAEDVMAEQIPWQPLILVDDVPPLPAITSKEKDIQTEREKTCLKTIYFNRSMIPDSPAEPDVIAYPNVDPKPMPLFDITGNPDAVHDFTNMPWPEPKGSPAHTAGNIDDMNGFSNFTQFGQSQFGNMNWPLGQQPNNMMNLRPPQAIQPFGAMIPPDAMNPMTFPRAMNPAMPNNFGPNGPSPGFINNFNGPMQAMGRGGANGPPNNNWYGNMNGPNNNWQTQQPMAANNPNNARPGWMQGRRLCKQFQRGFCRHGDTCKFLHPGVNCPPF